MIAKAIVQESSLRIDPLEYVFTTEGHLFFIPGGKLDQKYKNLQRSNLATGVSTLSTTDVAISSLDREVCPVYGYDVVNRNSTGLSSPYNGDGATNSYGVVTGLSLLGLWWQISRYSPFFSFHRLPLISRTPRRFAIPQVPRHQVRRRINSATSHL